MALKHFLVIALAALTLSACSSDDADKAGMLGDATDTTGLSSTDTMDAGSIEPGSYADLVANVGDRVFFEFNSAALTESAQATLRAQATWLQQYSGSQITIEGHCDERGTREYNLALGERRANAVKNFLTSLGVDSSRVTVISYGKEHPEFLGSSEAEWSKNRRGVTVVN